MTTIQTLVLGRDWFCCNQLPEDVSRKTQLSPKLNVTQQLINQPLLKSIHILPINQLGPKYFTERFKMGVINRQPEMLKLAQQALQASKMNTSWLVGKQHPYSKRYSKLKTLVLDLDQTLIFAGPKLKDFADFIQNLQKDNSKSYLGLSIRPYARYFLQRISRYYQVILFTAGNKIYADKVVQKLDPSRYITHCFYRQDCTVDLHNPQNSHHKIKNLEGLGLPLSQVLIVDNSPFSYILQPANGIPIFSYRNEKEDSQLLWLLEYLVQLQENQDLVKRNNQYFKLTEYKKFSDPFTLVNSLY